MKRCLNCNIKFHPKRQDALYCCARCRVNGNRKRNISVTDNSDKTILSLCDHSGAWSAPYAAAGYAVKQIDLKLANPQDVRLLKCPGRLYGILAAPPCTVFAISGNRWTRTDRDLIEEFNQA